jgi:DNA-binding response OmpR family regulator
VGGNGQLILVVEDAADVRRLVCTVLDRAGFTVAEAEDGHLALQQFYGLRPDVVVLDVGLPELDGWQVLERIRTMSETPVLMLTALGSERDKIRGLDGGADDYLVKPFSNGELVARVRALTRRTRERRDPATSFDDGTLHIDYVGCRVKQHGEVVHLTRTEFNLLSVLTTHKGQVLSPDQLMERAWLDPSGLSSKKVKFTVLRLRKSMGWDAVNGPIETVSGFGYCYRGTAA